MQKDPYLQSLFKLGMMSLCGNTNDENVAKLHDELVQKVLYTEIAHDVKEYADSKSKKMLTNTLSSVSFRTALKCALKKNKIKS
jgi:hypothetical protein